MIAPASVGSVDPGGLTRRLLVRTAIVGVGAFAAVGLLAPWALLLAPELLPPIASRGALLALAAIGFAVLASMRVLRKNRYVLRSLALGSRAIEPGDVGALADLPFALTVRFCLVSAAAPLALFVPGLRVPGIDLARVVSLVLLVWTVLGAAAVLHYITVREAALRVLERCPVEPITEWLEQQARRLAPRRRVQRKILVAVVAPVALVGVGTLLVTHAHLRAFVERERVATAITLARATLEPGPGAVALAGRSDAIEAVRPYGYEVLVETGADKSPPADVLLPRREPDGQLRVSVPLDDGHALLRFGAELSSQAVGIGALLTLLAVIVAAWIGGRIGRVLADDLAIATAQVSSLGTEQAMRGRALVAGTARFGAVAGVGHAVNELAERFREFARAHERAIAARESAQRMKELLFASVSHDLKSPLNAVLGFSELVREEPLTDAQAESLEIVVSRGRELLALIETIVDAARVEAGQLQLAIERTEIDPLVRLAVAKSRDLTVAPSPAIVTELAADLPAVAADPAYAPRALAVFVSHALQSSPPGSTQPVKLTASVATRRASSTETEPLATVRLRIEYPDASASPELLAAQLRGESPSAVGRGMVLRLGLARALIELHHGQVTVERTPRGAPIVSCWLPVSLGRSTSAPRRRGRR